MERGNVMSEKLKTQVGANIRRLRLEKNLSQEQLAYCSRMGAAHLGNLERGRGNATLDTLERIAQALGVEVWALCRQEDFED